MSSDSTRAMLLEMSLAGDPWARAELAALDSAARLALCPPPPARGLSAAIARQKRRDAAKHAAVEARRAEKRAAADHARHLEIASAARRAATAARLGKIAVDVMWVRAAVDREHERSGAAS